MAEARILVVDDEEDVLMLVRVSLEFEGFDVTEAADGGQALDAIRANPPDLVLLDVMMPNKDGWETLEALRADPSLSDVRIVMLTAKAAEEDQYRALAAGAASYVTKPFHPSALVDVVKDVLRAGADDLEARRVDALRKLELYRKL